MINITPANRVTEITEYYFSRKLKEIARLNASGADIISLGIGGPDLPPHHDVIETLATTASRDDVHSYQSYNGIRELRDAFAQWYQREYGVTLDPIKEILPLIGSKEGIMHISLAFLNHGDGVLVPNPGYPTYTSVSRLVGAEIFNYDLTEQNGWMPDFEALEKLPLDRIKLMWVNYPHMPTGTPATTQLLGRLVEFGKRHNIVIAHDNPYSFILNDNPMSILAIDGAKDIAIELNSLSKSHNMAGWRVAMAASNPQFIEWITKVKSNIDSGQFKPVMLAAAKALSLGRDWNAALNDTYRQRREVALEIMKAIGCKVDMRQTGLFLWGRIPDDCKSSIDMADEILSRARVFVTPGAIFGSNGDRYLRISLCAPAERMKMALDRIKQSYNSLTDKQQ